MFPIVRRQRSMCRINVFGEQHYLVRIAIDRFTGYMLDKQIDQVNEQRVLRTTTGDSGDQKPHTPNAFVVARFVSDPGRSPFGERRLDLLIRQCLPAAEPYGHLIRAVNTARFAHLICKGSRAPLACVIGIAARDIGYCGDAHAIALNVEVAEVAPFQTRSTVPIPSPYSRWQPK